MEIIWETGRDNSRTPMQWNDVMNAGFSDGVPWLKVNPNYKDINVAKEMQDPDSIYHYYKQLIKLRKENPVLIYGNYDIVLEKHDQVYAYTRTLDDEKLLIMTNLFAKEAEVSLPKKMKLGSLLLSNYDVGTSETDSKLSLQAYEARVYRLK